MGLAEIADQVALKVAAVAGVAGASGAGVTTGVPGIPLELTTFPYAVVYLGPGRADQQGMSQTVLDDEFEIRVYVPYSSLPVGNAVLLPIADAIEVAWRGDRDLGGTCEDSRYLSRADAIREVWGGDAQGNGGVSYWALPVRISVTRRIATTLTS